MFALKRLTTGRSIDRFRAFYSALVLLQLVTIGLYENDWLPGGVALLPGLITSLAGPFLSFLINLHNLRHRRTRTIDVTSALLSYLFTCISFAVLALIISDADTGAFNVVLGTKRSGFETSLYFSIVTITTTGYGDIAPVSHLARGLACWEIMTGLYFVLANLGKVKLPENYVFPPHVADRPRDFKLSWFLIMELGVAAIPPTEFYTDANAHLAEEWLRFAVCKNDEVLEGAKERLRGLKKYMS